MAHEDLTVGIVGAGPTGLTLAYVLARAGVRATVVDREGGPGRESSRATTVHAGTLEALDALDGLGEEIAAAGLPARRSHVRSGDRILATVRWDRMPTRYAALVNLPQAALEGILERRLAELGLSVEWGRSIDSTEEVTADYIVGCDGAHSVIRRSIRVRLDGTTSDERFLLADVRLSGDLDQESTNIWVSTAGVLGILPMPDGSFRLNGTLADGEACDAASLGDLLARRLGRADRRIHLDDVGWAAEYRTHSRLATAYRRGRAFLAGDAAHLNSPVGGQGMNVGICDAIDLGRRLVALRDGAPESHLDGYEASRRPVAERVIGMTERATAMLTARRPVERRLRNAALWVGHRLPPVQRLLSTDTAFAAA
jgi:2-polyprenyl-6-methoxyphenol hydroxylase-like FAD-dependent oxidoreductase